MNFRNSYFGIEWLAHLHCELMLRVRRQLAPSPAMHVISSQKNQSRELYATMLYLKTGLLSLFFTNQ